MKQFIFCCIFLAFIPFHFIIAQDSLPRQLPGKYLYQVKHKSEHIEELVNKRTNKALEHFSKQELKMKARLWKIDSIAAKKIFSRSIDKLNDLKAGLKNKVPGNSQLGQNAYLDTLQNSLKFLDGSKTLLGSSQSRLNDATQSVKDLQGKLQYVETVKAYIRERKQQLKAQLGQYAGFTKDLQKMNKQAYYYSEQLNEYKSLMEDKKKAETKAVELLKKLPAYNDFIQKNSQFASLFNLASYANTTQSLQGLQTRSQLEQLVQQRIGSSPMAQQAVNQQMEQARAQFTELKSKFPNLDNAADMPDFHPNPMKTKSFIRRLEFGFNIQFQRSTRYFPTTTDIAGQIAYKFHKNGSAGVGISYKLGMGTGWNDISFSHEGIGLRSIVDWKMKGTFFLNGGFEENFLSAFSHVDQLKNGNGWQRSALLGISKKYKAGTKLKGNIIILYDFLAQKQLPKISPVKLRIGYAL